MYKGLHYLLHVHQRPRMISILSPPLRSRRGIAQKRPRKRRTVSAAYDPSVHGSGIAEVGSIGGNLTLPTL